MTFAVIKTGGKQYKVAANDVLKIEKIEAQPGDVVTFDQVLVVGDGDNVTVGTPLVAGATVAAHFLGTKKARTVIIQKKHRRQHFDRRNGHRQQYSTIRIGEILVGGAQTTLSVDERAKARAAALLGSAAPAVSAAPVESAKPARKAAAKTAAPATDSADAAPAKKAPAKKAAAKKTTEGDAPAAKKAPAKKAAPKADKE